MAIAIAKLAQEMLTKAAPSFEVLKTYLFHSDHEAHDDKLQDELAARFDGVFQIKLFELAAHFGKPSHLDTPCADLPMNCFRSAVWYAEGKAISLLASHEDRECPFVILLSVTQKK